VFIDLAADSIRESSLLSQHLDTLRAISKEAAEVQAELATKRWIN